MRSGRDGCAPSATRCARASSTVLRMTCGSPPWNPHATLAELMNGMMASSAPSVQRPYDSPMSQYRSIILAIDLYPSFKCARLAFGCTSQSNCCKSSRYDAVERLDEAIDVGVGHGQRAGAEA